MLVTAVFVKGKKKQLSIAVEFCQFKKGQCGGYTERVQFTAFAGRLTEWLSFISEGGESALCFGNKELACESESIQQRLAEIYSP